MFKCHKHKPNCCSKFEKALQELGTIIEQGEEANGGSSTYV